MAPPTSPPASAGRPKRKAAAVAIERTRTVRETFGKHRTRTKVGGRPSVVNSDSDAGQEEDQEEDQTGSDAKKPTSGRGRRTASKLQSKSAAESNSGDSEDDDDDESDHFTLDENSDEGGSDDDSAASAEAEEEEESDHDDGDNDDDEDVIGSTQRRRTTPASRRIGSGGGSSGHRIFPTSLSRSYAHLINVDDEAAASEQLENLLAANTVDPPALLPEHEQACAALVSLIVGSVRARFATTPLSDLVGREDIQEAKPTKAQKRRRSAVDREGTPSGSAAASPSVGHNNHAHAADLVDPEEWQRALAIMPTMAIVIPTSADHRLQCPLCVVSTKSTAAFVNHVRNTSHSLGSVLARVCPRRPIDPRSPLLGNLPDTHELAHIATPALEMLFKIPAALYPVTLNLGAAWISLPEQNRLHRDLSASFLPPEFDLSAYVQLKPVYEANSDTVYSHLEGLVRMSAREKLLKLIGEDALSAGGAAAPSSPAPNPAGLEAATATAAVAEAGDDEAPLPIPICGVPMTRSAAVQLQKDNRRLLSLPLSRRARRGGGAPTNPGYRCNPDEAGMPVALQGQMYDLLGPRIFDDDDVGDDEPDIPQATQDVITIAAESLDDGYVPGATDFAARPEDASSVNLLWNGDTEATTIPPLTAHTFESSLPGNRSAHLINAGGSVWGASWLGSYLAVGGYKDTNSHYVVGERIQEANTIQIWHVPLASAGSSTSASSTSAAGKSKRRQKMSRDHDDDDVDDADDNTNGTNKKNGSAPASPRLALLLEHQWGPCFNLEWWPGSASSVHDNTSPLLGILGGCFGDGAFRLLAVPRPTPDIDEPVVLQVQSVLMKAYRPDTTYFCFTFGGDRRVALGCANGFITIYDIPWALANPVDPEPMAHFPAHDAFVRDVSFESGAEVPNVLSTSGADGRLNVWDLRDLFVPIPLFRARAFLMSCEWSKCADSVYFADSDHALRVYRMPDIRGSAVLLMHRSTIWSQCTSAHHPFLVTASADGLVKAVNAHRVRHRVVKPASLLALSVSVIDPQGTFQYRDNLGYEEFDGSLLKKEAGYVLKSDQRVALQTASWNPERRHAGWIAVGGANGIVSILNLEQ